MKDCTDLTLVLADESRISDFVALEAANDASGYIVPGAWDMHQLAMSQPDIHYFDIVVGGQSEGFIIIAFEQNHSVELRRIVVKHKGQGIGQAALTSLETQLFTSGTMRIWLDVFEDNARGRYIYQKLGFKAFGESTLQGKKLILMEKFAELL